MTQKNDNEDLEKVTATIRSKSKIRNRCRFVGDPTGDHSYQGELYDYEGIDCSITLDDSVRDSYRGITHLIFGLGLHTSYYDDVPKDHLVERYKEASKKLSELADQINVGDMVEIAVSKDQFQRNRTDSAGDRGGYYPPIKFTHDPCLWRRDCLLYSPFGYEPINHGDGRRTVDPEVKNVKVIQKS
ncbi:MAG: hypothetical protein MAG795_00247 [Candidatus Woesearchaeota archaeon]|nr:hypothetical protein [Candidatus Woesearchaeota archaeon]